MANFKSLALFCMLLVAPMCIGANPDNIFILAGQSNMAGRGGVEKNSAGINEWDQIIPPESQSNPSTLRFSIGLQWEPASEPLHKDIDNKKTNGIGPGMALANTLLQEGAAKINGTVGLVPCAIGGTQIKQWMKDEPDSFYADGLIKRARAAAQQGGTIRALFWFQGETDAAIRTNADAYQANLEKLIGDVRNDLCLPNLPFFVVEISTYDTYLNPHEDCRDTVRKAMEAVSATVPNVCTVDSQKVVGADGLDMDQVHLNVHSEVGVGQELARAYLSLT